MAHVLHRFVEVEKTASKKAKSGTGHAALNLIGKPYDVKHHAEKPRPILDKL